MRKRTILLTAVTLLSCFSLTAQEQKPEVKSKTVYVHPAALSRNEFKFSLEVKQRTNCSYEYSASIQVPTISKFNHQEGMLAEARLNTTNIYNNKLRASVGLFRGVKRFGENHPKRYWGHETTLRYLWFHDKYMAYESGISNEEWVGKYSVDEVMVGEMIQIGAAPSLKVGSTQRLVFDFYLGVGAHLAYNQTKTWDYVEGSSNIENLNVGYTPKITETKFMIGPTIKFGLKIGLQWGK